MQTQNDTKIATSYIIVFIMIKSFLYIIASKKINNHWYTINCNVRACENIMALMVWYDKGRNRKPMFIIMKIHITLDKIWQDVYRNKWFYKYVSAHK